MLLQTDKIVQNIIINICVSALKLHVYLPI